MNYTVTCYDKTGNTISPDVVIPADNNIYRILEESNAQND